jgi:hypothetical protein
MPRRPFLLLCFLVSCRSTPATPLRIPSNASTASDWAPTLAVRAADVPGWLGLASVVGDATTAVVLDVEATPGTLLAIPATGDPEPVVAGAATMMPYGCDQTPLHVVPLKGAASLADGPVWVVPMPAPDGWHPAAAALRATEATRERQRWTAGPLTLSLTRVDDGHATLEIAGDGRRLHVATEATYWMDGSDPQPLDLTATFLPGIALPEAVFLLAPAGPALVVFHTKGFEGDTYTTLLVGADAAEPVDRMTAYLYSCAF